MAEETKTTPATLEEAIGVIAEQKAMIETLSNSVKDLEGKNTELTAQQSAAAISGNAIVTSKGVNYKANAAAYRVTDDNGKTTVIVLNKDVLEAKQKVFGKENVRMATEDDMANLLKEKSNLIEKITKK